MASLLALGGTCQYFRDRVSETLTKERDAILEHYWFNARHLLKVITWSQAIVTGEAALAFIMCNRSLLTDVLEICVSAQASDDLVDDFRKAQGATPAISDMEWPTWSCERPTVFPFKTTAKRFIHIIASNTSSPFTPMTTYPTSALFNYFDNYLFSCAYCNLTMNGRGVAPELPLLDAEDGERIQRMVDNADFKISQWPASVAFPNQPFAFFDHLALWNHPDEQNLVNSTCLRTTYQCPGQTRFFGDRGSLVEFFAPHLLNYSVMAHLGYAPYGMMAIWRMPGSECDLRCNGSDYRLRGSCSEVSSMSCSILYGLFTCAVVGKIRIGESKHE